MDIGESLLEFSLIYYLKTSGVDNCMVVRWPYFLILCSIVIELCLLVWSTDGGGAYVL